MNTYRTVLHSANLGNTLPHMSVSPSQSKLAVQVRLRVNSVEKFDYFNTSHLVTQWRVSSRLPTSSMVSTYKNVSATIGVNMTSVRNWWQGVFSCWPISSKTLNPNVRHVAYNTEGSAILIQTAVRWLTGASLCFHLPIYIFLIIGVLYRVLFFGKT